MSTVKYFEKIDRKELFISERDSLCCSTTFKAKGNLSLLT